LQLRRHGSRAVLVDLELPHLVRLEEDPLRTEIMLYRIMVSKLSLFVVKTKQPREIKALNRVGGEPAKTAVSPGETSLAARRYLCRIQTSR